MQHTRIQGAINHGLTIFSHIGFIFFDVVYVAAVMNYVAQSEMNIYLLCAIKSFVLDNKYHNNMKEAMKVSVKLNMVTQIHIKAYHSWQAMLDVHLPLQ